MNKEQLLAQLRRGLAVADLPATPEQCDKVLAYLELLLKWNKAYNLTGIRDPQDMLTLNILDSLVLLPWMDAPRIADVGSGAGLPGIPLAIFLPDHQFVLIDSNSKKTRFMFQAKVSLGLGNVEVHHGRVESYARQAQVDIVTSRAYASLADFVQGTRHLLAPGGRFLAMKGQYPQQEIETLPEDFTVSRVHVLQVPGVAAERHLVEIVAAKVRDQGPLQGAEEEYPASSQQGQDGHNTGRSADKNTRQAT